MPWRGWGYDAVRVCGKCFASTGEWLFLDLTVLNCKLGFNWQFFFLHTNGSRIKIYQLNGRTLQFAVSEIDY